LLPLRVGEAQAAFAGGAVAVVGVEKIEVEKIEVEIEWHGMACLFFVSFSLFLLLSSSSLSLSHTHTPSAASEVICRLQSSDPSALLPTTTSLPAARVVVVFDGEAMAKNGDDDGEEEEEEERLFPPRCRLCRGCCDKEVDGLDEEATPPRGRAAICKRGAAWGRRGKRIESERKSDLRGGGTLSKKQGEKNKPLFDSPRRERAGSRARCFSLSLSLSLFTTHQRTWRITSLRL